MNIGYHTRLWRDNTVKVCGGSFGGEFSLETANRLVKSHFTVTVKATGTPVFVDKQGREVSLYMSVDARATEAGKIAMAAYYKAEQEREAQERRDRDAFQANLDEAMSGLSNEEIIRRLKNEP